MNQSILRTALIPAALGACLIQACPDVKDDNSKLFLGADVSALGSSGRSGRGLLPYQEDGKPSDEVTIFAHHGWTAFRLRVFVSPVRLAPNNSLANTIPLAKHLKELGAKFVLDLHFSDTWADPQHQDIPVAWRGLSVEVLAKQWEKHAYDTMKALKDAGATPDVVQIGNEITRGAAWPLAQLDVPGSKQYLAPEPYDEKRQWKSLCMLIKAGIRGVESAAGKGPRIAIHIDKGADWETTKWFFDHLRTEQVRFDVIAQSFYPEWHHGKLEGLWKNMTECAKRYRKDFLVAETGYGRSHVADNDDMLWPQTPEGRLQFMVDLVNTVKKAPRGIGVMYWAPEWQVWNSDGTPGPAVFTMDNLAKLSKRPESKAPEGVSHASG